MTLLADIAEVTSGFLKYASEKANFPVGIVLGLAFGCLSNHLANRGAHKERTKRADYDHEREKELRSQLNEKDARISNLHDEIAKLAKRVRS